MEGRPRGFLRRVSSKLAVTARSATQSSRRLITSVLSAKSQPQNQAEYIQLDLGDNYDFTEEALPTPEFDRTMVCCHMGDPFRKIAILHDYDDIFQLTNPDDPFPFLDLPVDIQLMILDYIVNPYPGKQWTAYVDHIEAGIKFYRRGQSTKPTMYIDEPVMWRTNTGPTTGNLLLTSHAVHDLTISTLQSSFSGFFKPQGQNQQARLSRLDMPDHFFRNLHPESPFALRHAWVLDRVLHLVIDRQEREWLSVVGIMPRLQTVKLKQRCISNIQLPASDGSPLEDLRGRFLRGELDTRVELRHRLNHTEEPWQDHRQDLLSICRETLGDRDTPEVYVEIAGDAVFLFLGADTEDPKYYGVHELPVWPEMGKIRDFVGR